MKGFMLNERIHVLLMKGFEMIVYNIVTWLVDVMTRSNSEKLSLLLKKLLYSNLYTYSSLHKSHKCFIIVHSTLGRYKIIKSDNIIQTYVHWTKCLMNDLFHWSFTQFRSAYYTVLISRRNNFVSKPVWW